MLISLICCVFMRMFSLRIVSFMRRFLVFGFLSFLVVVIILLSLVYFGGICFNFTSCRSGQCIPRRVLVTVNDSYYQGVCVEEGGFSRKHKFCVSDVHCSLGQICSDFFCRDVSGPGSVFYELVSFSNTTARAVFDVDISPTRQMCLVPDYDAELLHVDTYFIDHDSVFRLDYDVMVGNFSRIHIGRLFDGMFESVDYYEF